MTPADEPQLYFNPRCSKCRTAEGLLKEHGAEATLVRYLDQAPSVADLQVLMTQLGIDDPVEMMRTGEPVYSDLGLEGQPKEKMLAAIAEHPILLERPIFVFRGRAVIARPPERLLEIL